MTTAAPNRDYDNLITNIKSSEAVMNHLLSEFNVRPVKGPQQVVHGRFHGFSPFRSEKSGSFHIKTRDGEFVISDFGGQTGMDVIEFYAAMKGVESKGPQFREIISTLASHAGISTGGKGVSTEAKLVGHSKYAARQAFRENRNGKFTEDENIAAFRNYMHHRGLIIQVPGAGDRPVTRFLGDACFLPVGGIEKFLKKVEGDAPKNATDPKEKVAVEHLVRAGLLNTNGSADRSTWSSPLEGRIIFPVSDLHNPKAVTGFVGMASPLGSQFNGPIWVNTNGKPTPSKINSFFYTVGEPAEGQKADIKRIILVRDPIEAIKNQHLLRLSKQRSKEVGTTLFVAKMDDSIKDEEVVGAFRKALGKEPKELPFTSVPPRVNPASREVKVAEPVAHAAPKV